MREKRGAFTAHTAGDWTTDITCHLSAIVIFELFLSSAWSRRISIPEHANKDECLAAAADLCLIEIHMKTKSGMFLA
jgi:hypothetical protein